MSDNFDDNQFEPLEEEQPEDGKSKGPGNRPFIVIIGILAGIFLLSLAALAAYAFLIQPQQRAAHADQVALINAQNTATAAAATSAAQTQAVTNTPLPTKVPPTSTPVPSTSTPVVAVATATLAPVEAKDMQSRTQTVAALLSAAGGASITGTPAATSTALPKTGFADEVGLPGMFGIALALIAVIFFARRLRVSSNN
jgi:LPXTG-motif cell wall-anchored protein